MKTSVLLADSRFWQAATVAMPASVATAIFVVVALAGVGDGIDLSSESSSGWLFGIAVGALILFACLLGSRRTPRSSGVALGVAVAGLLVGYVGLVVW